MIPPAWPAAAVALPMSAVVVTAAALPVVALVVAAMVVSVAGAVAASGSETDKVDKGYREEQKAAAGGGGGKAKKMIRSRCKSLRKTRQRNRKRHGRKSRHRL